MLTEQRYKEIETLLDDLTRHAHEKISKVLSDSAELLPSGILLYPFTLEMSKRIGVDLGGTAIVIFGGRKVGSGELPSTAAVQEATAIWAFFLLAYVTKKGGSSDGDRLRWALDAYEAFSGHAVQYNTHVREVLELLKQTYAGMERE